MVIKKVSDYSTENYVKKLQTRIDNLQEIIEGAAFQQQMSRFLKTKTMELTVANPEYRKAMERTVNDLLVGCLREFS